MSVTRRVNLAQLGAEAATAMQQRPAAPPVQAPEAPATTAVRATDRPTAEQGRQGEPAAATDVASEPESASRGRPRPPARKRASQAAGYRRYYEYDRKETRLRGDQYSELT